MLNKATKLALVSTALAPIFLTLWFVEISTTWEAALPWQHNLAAHWQAGSAYLLAALVLSGLCFGLVWLSASRHGLERLPVKIKAVKTVDKEIVGFFAGLPAAADQPEPEHHQPASIGIRRGDFLSYRLQLARLPLQPFARVLRLSLF